MTIKLIAAGAAALICALMLGVIASAMPISDDHTFKTYNVHYRDGKIDDSGLPGNIRTYLRYMSNTIEYLPDDPSLTASVSAPALKQRYVYTKLTGVITGETVTCSEQGFEPIGDGGDYLTARVWCNGDYGTGFAVTAVFNDIHCDSNKIACYRRLDVTS